MEWSRSRGRLARKADTASLGSPSWTLACRTQHHSVRRPRAQAPAKAPASQHQRPRGVSERSPLSLGRPGPELPSWHHGARRPGVPPDRAQTTDLWKTPSRLCFKAPGFSAVVHNSDWTVYIGSTRFSHLSRFNFNSPQEDKPANMQNPRVLQTHSRLTRRATWGRGSRPRFPGPSAHSLPLGCVLPSTWHARSLGLLVSAAWNPLLALESSLLDTWLMKLLLLSHMLQFFNQRTSGIC